jgi:hypothetical protein
MFVHKAFVRYMPEFPIKRNGDIPFFGTRIVRLPTQSLIGKGFEFLNFSESSVLNNCMGTSDFFLLIPDHYLNGYC